MENTRILTRFEPEIGLEFPNFHGNLGLEIFVLSTPKPIPNFWNSQLFFQDYIAVKEKYAKYLPHSAGRYAAKRFRKAQCPIVERLTNSMMMHGRNNGKKLMTVRIVKHAFEIIHLLTGE
ncbi:40S ribosomal protein S5, partial [Onychostruthus taczanowskii]|uniref:40S ribosomal protein S5 n=1 Tax=Onychostruthus taczanowskii TaxID=356909 RepID=UPI001B808591